MPEGIDSYINTTKHSFRGIWIYTALLRVTFGWLDHHLGDRTSALQQLEYANVAEHDGTEPKHVSHPLYISSKKSSQNHDGFFKFCSQWTQNLHFAKLFGPFFMFRLSLSWDTCVIISQASPHTAPTPLESPHQTWPTPGQNLEKWLRRKSNSPEKWDSAEHASM